MKLYNLKSNSSFVNLIADSIVMALKSKSIISVTLSDELVIVNGLTESKDILNLNDIKNLVSSCSYDIFNENKSYNVIETIKYNRIVSDNYNINKLKVYNSIRPIFDLDSPPVNENKLQYTSEFPYGYCLEFGRLPIYYSEMIFKNIGKSIGLEYGEFTIENKRIFFNGKSFLSNSAVESLILDYFDFNFTGFKKVLNNYDFTRDIKYPLETKPWLSDELILKIEVF